MTKFSIVIPVFNASTTIHKVLNAVVKQVYPPHEVIIVDDGSKDSSVSIIESFISENKTSIIFKLSKFDKNRGVSHCRNYGWKLAEGNYIAFLDSDDYWHPNKLEYMKDVIELTNADLVGHRYSEDTFDPSITNGFDKKRILSISFNKLLIRNKFQTSCVLVKASISERFDENISHSEDYELFLRLSAKNYTLYFYDQVLTFLGRPQLSKGGLSEKKIKMRLGELQAYRNSLAIKKRRYLLPMMYLCSFLKFLRKANK